jgi:hypothetical protein
MMAVLIILIVPSGVYVEIKAETADAMASSIRFQAGLKPGTQKRL